MELLSAVHNIVSVSPEIVPEPMQGHQMIHYMDSKDCVVIAGWKEDTQRIAGVIADYMELSPAGQQKADEFLLATGKDSLIGIDHALKEIARIRREQKGQIRTMRTDKIKIYPCFAAHPPKPEKMERKEQYYREHGSFESEIILDRSGHLLDGFTSYLLAEKYDVPYVSVRYGRRQIITATHNPGGKRFQWELSGLLMGKVHAGDKVTVQTARGFRRVTVETVEEYTGQEQEPLKMAVRKGRIRRR